SGCANRNRRAPHPGESRFGWPMTHQLRCPCEQSARLSTVTTVLTVLDHLLDATFLFRIGEVTVRVIEATVTTAESAVTHGNCRLLTSLLDPGEAPATALIRFYPERWEIETSYCEPKSTHPRRPGPARPPPHRGNPGDLGLLVAYPVLRTAMTD